jgi:hypothetical protein
MKKGPDGPLAGFPVVPAQAGIGRRVASYSNSQS